MRNQSLLRRTAGMGAILVSVVACGDGGSKPPPGQVVVNPATTGGDYRRPSDAVPVGDDIYFTAMNDLGGGVFKVAGAGGSASAVHVGDPYIAPFGIDVATDGSSLYVADPAATVFDPEVTETTPDRGRIFVQSKMGGAPSELAGANGLEPRSLVVVRQGDADNIYFTGRTTEGQVAVFQLPSVGGTASVIGMGGGMRDPSGIAVTTQGTAYVLDTVASSGKGTLFQIQGSTVSEFLADVPTGYPAGIALTVDESSLIVSALNPDTGFDRVFSINLATKAITEVDDPQITSNRESAGLHRAHGSNTFSWADSTAGADGKGIVYRVTIP